MYDLYTSAALFFILAPGVLVSLPPGGSIHVVALVHAIVFFVVNQYVSAYVPVWAIWLVAAVVFFARFYMARQQPTGLLGMNTPVLGGRRH
jgi:hypothetical protein